MKPLVRTLMAALSLALLLRTVPCSAGPTIYTYTSTQPETPADWTHDFLFPKFNPALGTLESVHILASFDINTFGSISNTDQASKVCWFQAASFLTLTLPNALGDLQAATYADNIHYKLPAFSSASYGAYSTNGMAEITLTGAAMTPFIGVGSVDLPADTSTQQILQEMNGGGGKIVTSLETSAGALLTLEYYDSQVPEPSSCALFAVVIAGRLLLPRKRL